MTSFSAVVIGNESLLIGCADILLARGHTIRAVVSTDPDIRQWARDKGLPLLDKVDEIPSEFDWLLSIANLTVLSADVLARATQGAVNFHDGPLPAYAGLNTPNWALLNGEVQHGITWHLMTAGVDEGDILARRMFDVAEDETAISLNSKCYAAAMDSIGDVLTQLESGDLQRQPQEPGPRRMFAKADRPAADGLLDLSRPAPELARQVRALDTGGYWNPLCAAKLLCKDTVVLVGAAAMAEGAGAVGEVLGVEKDSITIATCDGAVQLSRLTTTIGQALDITAQFTLGDKLPTLTAEDMARITQQMAATQRGEPYWRRQLAALQPVQVPLASATGADGNADCSIALPAGINKTQVAAAVLAWALLGSSEDGADIALATAGEHALPALISNWVPLGARRDEQVPALLERVTQEIEKAQKYGGFASDLPARAPEISMQQMPAIGLNLDADIPVAGCAATVAFCAGKMCLHWDKSQLSEAAAALLAARLEQVLVAITSHDDGTVSGLPLLPETERRMLLEDWNQTTTEVDTQQTIHAAFEAQVADTPKAQALVFEDQAYSYEEVNARANAIAARLQQMGVRPGSHVGLHIPRGPGLVFAALGVMKAGGAYVPLDPAYPVDRIAHYIRDSQAQVIVTQGALAASLPHSDAQVLEIESVTETLADNVTGSAAGSDLAYLIYTSGSTGTPKGVMVTHANVANFFAGMDQRIPHQPGNAWLAVTSLSFDISVLELFWTLTRGFKLVLSSDESRLELSKGPVAMSDRKMDFNLFYWGNDDGPGLQKYNLLLEGAKFADQNGFNAVWTPERHFHAFGGPYPNPAVTGAAVAAVTQNIGVRGGSCVAPLHHPARIAEEWAVIDNLTAGRAGIGFASGWQPDDFILRPENTPPANKPALFDAIETVRKLWRGEEVGFARQDGSEHAVITQPRPVATELPVWVTTAGNPETWREAGAIGANVLTHLLGQSIDEVAGKIRIYHDALRDAGHDPADFKVTLMLHSYLAKTREEARRVAREPMKDYLRSAAGLIKQYAWAFPAFKRPEGVKNPFDVDLGSLSEDELEAILDFAFERYFEDSGLFGTIADACQRVEELKRIGVDEIACLIDYGIAPDVVLEGLKPLAEVLRRSNMPQELAADDFSLAAQIVRHDVTHLQCTPSMARMIVADRDARACLGRLQDLLIGGEALPGDLVSSLQEAGAARLHNMYGPTETTIWSTVAQIAAAPTGVAGIGTPIANTQVHVLDDDQRPVPIGAAGELYIGGMGVTAGYWQRPELTAERFVHVDWAEGPLYRTGDLVRWTAEGGLAFLGRSDHQVKLRGQRIELGEIEAALAAQPGVTGAVVVPRGNAGAEQLVGYVTANAAINEDALKQALAARLAEVMVPAHIVTLETFPLTPNKKIDRKALPDPQPKRIDAAPAVPLSDGAQARIAAVWGRILGVENIGAQDNFFALGGHSLLAVQAHRELRETLTAPQLSITDIFRFPTLAGLAAHIDGQGQDAQTRVAGGSASAENQPQTTTGPDRSDTMSKRRAMRANRRTRAG
jgi:natural product biosynthesis luciferase-like monooxygenase protein